MLFCHYHQLLFSVGWYFAYCGCFRNLQLSESAYHNSFGNKLSVEFWRRRAFKQPLIRYTPTLMPAHIMCRWSCRMPASSLCVSSATQAVNVTNVSCTANSGFSIVPTTTAQYWNAIPSYPYNITNAVWSWGDNSSSRALHIASIFHGRANTNLPLCYRFVWGHCKHLLHLFGLQTSTGNYQRKCAATTNPSWNYGH